MPKDTPDTTALAERFMDALQRLEADAEDLNPLLETFSDNVELHNAALDLTQENYQGREEVRKFWTHYRRQFGEVSSEFQQLTTAERAAGLFWITRGKTAGGEAVEYHGATLLAFDDDGRVKHFRGYFDTRQLTVSKLA